MCLNCGCGEINERHGDQGNIVLEDLRRAATASGLDMSTTIKNLQTSLSRVGDTELATSGAAGRSSMDASGVGRTTRGPDAPGV